MRRRFPLAVLVTLVSLTSAAALADSPVLGLHLQPRGDLLVLEHPTIVPLVTTALQPSVTPAPPAHTAPVWQPPDATGYEAWKSDRFTVQLAAGSDTARHYSTGLDGFSPAPEGTLTDLAWNAVARAPEWIRMELISNLSLLTPARQDALAPLLVDEEDLRFLDELAFLLANVAPEDLARDQLAPRYLRDQVALLYEAEPLLDFVTLVEHGEPGAPDNWTTAAYTSLEAGQEKSFELPREVYYWYVVHPKLDGEELYDVNPQTGLYAPHPNGLTFREYYLMTPESPASYMTHYLFWPHEYYNLAGVDPATLSGWGPSARGHFTDFTIGPLEITRTDAGHVTTFEFRTGKGTVLGTTLRVEQAWADGTSPLLENMLRYGPGNIAQDEELLHLVVMEQAPFGLEGVIESILDDHGVNYQVVSADYLAEVDLSEVSRIIVPSDQPLAVYQALADHREALEEWLKPAWRVLEIHGAVAPEGDWSGLVMPGGFTAAELGGDGSDVVVVEGQPDLARIIPQTTVLWDSEEYPGLAGERLFDPTTFALDKWGWWASQNMFDNVSEWMDKHQIPPERTNFSVRIAWNHFGNCGECQDILTSVARTCLTAVANVSNSLEDHVWNEFYHDGQWYTYQISWSDSGTHIDHPGVSAGKKWGGGKNLSTVTMHRGDGALVNRTAHYADVVTVNLQVVDADEKPVDGAEVLIASEAFYKEGDSYPLSIAYWGITDSEGRLTLELGANDEEPMSNCLDPDTRCNNYYIRVESRLGSVPPEANTVGTLVQATDAVAGAVFDVTLPVEGSLSRPTPTAIMEYDSGNEDRLVRLHLDTVAEMACGIGLYGGLKYCDPAGDGQVLLQVLDYANYTLYQQGEPYQALAEDELGAGDDFLVNPPLMGDWYFVLGHHSRAGFELLLDGTLEVLERGGATPPDLGPGTPDVVAADSDPGTPDSSTSGSDTVAPGPESSPEEGDDKGGKSGSCSAGVEGNSPLSLLLFLLLLATTLAVRRRTGENR